LFYHFKRSASRRIMLAALAILPAAGTAQALAAGEDFPNRPIRVVVPYAAGGGTDVLARYVTRKVSELLGQSIVIENRPGAGTSIGASDIARSPADGYHLLWGDSGSFAVNPHIHPNLSYDPLKDFAPVTLTLTGTLILLARDGLGVNSVQDLIAYAKANPDKLNYGTPGNGTPHHLFMEGFKRDSGGLQIEHIAYKGEAPAIQDMLGGTLDVMFSGARQAAAQKDSGRIRPLAASGTQRNPVMPEVPTLAETGLDGNAYEYWHAVVAPAGTPDAVVDKLNTAFRAALTDPEVTHWLRTATGTQPSPTTPAELAAHMNSESAKAAILVRDIGLRQP